MQIVRDGDRFPEFARGAAVTIGAYDGVHTGHEAVINQVRERARPTGLATVVVTFDRHPASVVRPESAPLLLTDLDQKLELLERTGVDVAVVIRFDDVRAKEPADDFVTEVLVDRLRARVVVVGDDFHFGYQRQGTVGRLRELGARYGFEVEPVALVSPDGTPAAGSDAKVSSTAIRDALRTGDLATATRMLGRHHEVRGVVGHGDKRARTLGFPTANIEVPDDICLPADGVYAAWYERPDRSVHPAAVSLGRRPTFYDDQPYSLLEAHLLAGDGGGGATPLGGGRCDGPAVAAVEAVGDGPDLYGEAARVRFVERLRPEERFDSAEALVARMHDDCARARLALGR